MKYTLSVIRGFESGPTFTSSDSVGMSNCAEDIGIRWDSSGTIKMPEATDAEFWDTQKAECMGKGRENGLLLRAAAGVVDLEDDFCFGSGYEERPSQRGI